ncbi:MAG: hypothetical protein HQ562_02665 [Candidatus Marinimicrobia bacterium]|nr:hypothetical protein [Candidatus Neomarinimicrobiota bacterium]
MENSCDKTAIYLIACLEAWGVDLNVDKRIAGHNIGQYKGRAFLWPQGLTAEIVNPYNFDKLKTTLPITDLLIVDRLIGIDELVGISGHVNRCGTNFLIGQTPYQDNPYFPDSSNIYQKSPKLKNITVHTVGPKRFKQVFKDGQPIISEGLALIAMVAYYVGLGIKAVGIPPNKKNLFNINEIL